LVEQQIAHPLEQVFDVMPLSTTVEKTVPIINDPIKTDKYDDKDAEIERDLQTIYTKALSSFEQLNDEVELVEGKYKSRLAEVGSTYLNTALNAIREKSLLKQHKDKCIIAEKQAIKQTNNTNNTLVVSQAELVKLLRGDK
jgi:hypothetical protein